MMYPEMELKLALFGGHDVNLIWCVLVFFVIHMTVFYGLLSRLRNLLPRIVAESFFYGKTGSPATNPVSRSIEVPKHWFTHFYLFASALVPMGWMVCFSVYYLGHNPPPEFVLRTLDFFSVVTRPVSTSAGSAWLSLTLLCLQVWRRLYECLFVHVKSDAKMNLLHYIVGFAHYFCATLGILSEAPGFGRTTGIERGFDLQVSYFQVLCSVIFLIGWCGQFRAHKTFAALREGKNSKKYAIPVGGWFDFVSCPHYLAEILMYMCLAAILGPMHVTGLIIFGWVLVNQIIVSLMSHMWYLEKFEDYPRSRKAVIPFVL